MRLSETGDYERAIQLTRRLTEVEPSVNGYLNLVFELASVGWSDEARQIEAEAKGRYPASGGLHSLLIAIPIALGEYDRADSALAMYESYVETPAGLRMFTDHYMLPHAVERAAELYDQAGDLENAARYYARFIELWAEADPELQPRVEAAQARLQAIMETRG